MGKKSSFEIILGTYEEYILGFEYNRAENETTQTFAVHSHIGSIRCLAYCENLLASGSADDRIVVYDLKTRKEHCMLNHHNGTVTCLHFTKDRTHLISGSQDGSLAIVRVGNWQVEKLWDKAHNGLPIIDIAIHSSGKLALTIGGDLTLKTWNLVKGRIAYIINLNSKCKEPKAVTSIKLSPDNSKFILVGTKYIDLWSLDSGGLLKTVESKRKIASCVWQDDNTLLIGCEDGYLTVIQLESDTKTVTFELPAHEHRIKCIEVYKKRIITAASNGEIKVWNLKRKELCVLNAGCRYTCMCVTPINEDLNLPSQNGSVLEVTVEDDDQTVVQQIVEEFINHDIETSAQKRKKVSKSVEATPDTNGTEKRKSKKINKFVQF